MLPLLLLLALFWPQSFPADPPKACSSCAAWNADLAPFKLYGNTYYVGTAGLSAMLITSPQGHVLIDGGLPESAALIDGHIRALGFKTTDVKLILNSHAHFDHGGGIAALVRVSHAAVALSPSGAEAFRRGLPTPDDPQAGLGAAMSMPVVTGARVIADGEVLRVGPIAVTAHFTPGHAPGSTTWTWSSCERTRCLNIVYADSLNAVSADDFRFTGDDTHPSIVDAFRRSIARVAALPCDIIVSVHPSFTHLSEKLAAREQHPPADPFIDAAGCRAYAADAAKALDARIATEKTRVRFRSALFR